MKLEITYNDTTTAFSVNIPEPPEGWTTSRLPPCPPAEAMYLEQHGNTYRWVDSGFPLFNLIAVPDERTVDLSPIVGSNILCEFNPVGSEKHWSKVDKRENALWTTTHGRWFHTFTPVTGETYAHNGGSNPVPEGYEYEVTLRSGAVYRIGQPISAPMPALNFPWSEGPHTRMDVIFIKLIKLKPGWKLPG